MMTLNDHGTPIAGPLPHQDEVIGLPKGVNITTLGWYIGGHSYPLEPVHASIAQARTWRMMALLGIQRRIVSAKYVPADENNDAHIVAKTELVPSITPEMNARAFVGIL